MTVVESSASEPSVGRMVWRGLTKRCPRCGRGKLFTRWVRMVERCPHCGYRFEREEGFQLGGYVINFGVTEGLVCLVVAGYIVAAAANPDVAIWPVVVFGVIAAVVTPIVFFPFSRTIWAAIDLAMTPLDVVEQAEAETWAAATADAARRPTRSDAPEREDRAP
ncbi:MAG: DUF983 domain-containing protein [Acidimicrobiia bacterium]|nr:DUF983 domain-containing protein [Acidimicrobiia bacterium]